MLKKSIYIFALFSLILGSVPITSYALGEETFYHKGTNYVDTFESNQSTDVKDINASVAILSVATSYPANFGGKEHVRIFSRCQYVESYFDAYGCTATTASIGLNPTYNNVSTFIDTDEIYPAETNVNTNLDLISWAFKHPLVQGGFVVIDALANGGFSSWVSHEGNIPMSGRVTFHNIAGQDSDLEVPAQYTYDQVEEVYDGSNHGLSAYMQYSYSLNEGQVGYITARGHLKYDMRIPSNVVGVPPTPVWVTTSEVKVDHTITGK